MSRIRKHDKLTAADDEDEETVVDEEHEHVHIARIDEEWLKG